MHLPRVRKSTIPFVLKTLAYMSQILNQLSLMVGALRHKCTLVGEFLIVSISYKDGVEGKEWGSRIKFISTIGYWRKCIGNLIVWIQIISKKLWRIVFEFLFRRRPFGNKELRCTGWKKGTWIQSYFTCLLLL